MKKFNIFIRYSIFISILFCSCTDKILNEIDTDPVNPENVAISELMPQVTSGVAFTVSGTDLAWYCSVFVEHTAGVSDKMYQIDRRAEINSGLCENAWKDIYIDVLNDLYIIINKGSEGGDEEGNWKSVGIAKILYAYTIGVTTDLFGKVPDSEALQGSSNRQPAFDSQQTIYEHIQTLLDEAIENLDETSTKKPGSEDLFYGGDTELWKKAAWSLKARFYNHLSKIDAENSAENVLNCIENSFTSTDDDFTFNSFTDDATGEHPWYQESNDRDMFAVSRTFYRLLNRLDDPRIPLFFTEVDGSYAYVQNGMAVQDSEDYSKPSDYVVYATSPLPVMTYDELKFIEAEAHLRKTMPDATAAYSAYIEGVGAALSRQGIAQEDIDTYVAQTDVAMGESNLEVEDIITQKYFAFWLYQPIEAYNDWRRTGYPTMRNSYGEPPRRFPYPQTEISSNPDNCSDNAAEVYTSGIWWDDSTDD